MKAVVIGQHGGTDVLRIEERPTPEPSAAGVRVAIHAAGINHLDLWVRKGVEGHHFPLPMIPGSDGAGVVDAVGPEVTSVAVGDRVAIAPGYSCGVCAACLGGRQNLCRRYGIFGETRDGTNAEYVDVPEANLLPMPTEMSFVSGAAAPLVFLTAWHMLVDRCGVKVGDDVLIHAAGSGVSMAAIQIAKMHGARVIATAGSATKTTLALELGADHAIDYKEQDFGKVVKEITSRRGVDIAVDHVGGENISKTIRCLARGGRVVTCGATAGPELKADLRLVFFKNLTILGSTMGGTGEMHEVWSHIAAQRLKPVVAEVLGMDEVARGHELLESRSVFGKVVLVQ